ncbi:MAG: hypothetical protein A2Z38_04075 [Planctomycetes bacterium RBG_19FT_COMBO_48_8]|nr:MAG: hypothetical protein A2Z38_04075 [Planctomycetes bacterium RBG_19FT_COMBO_48_8]
MLYGLLSFIGWFLLSFLLSTLVLLLLFIIVARLQQFVKDRPNWVRTAVVLQTWPVILAGVAWDYVYQHTWGSLLFLELAPDGEQLLTARLQRWKRIGPVAGTWRWYLAIKLCDVIERIDPDHCRID